MRFSAKILFFLFFLLLSRPGLTQIQHGTQSANANSANIVAIVITCDAPVIKGVNRSSEMFRQLTAIINSDSNSLAKIARQSGAVWSLSSNLSGIQLSFFHADNPDLAASIARQTLKAFTKLDFNGMEQEVSHDFFSHLPAICPDIMAPHQAISIFTSGIAEETEQELASLTLQLNATYPGDFPRNLGHKPVMKNLPPVKYEIFSWPDNSEASFFSAKFAGEKFAAEFSGDDLASYEILYTSSGLKLILAVAGSENRLFKSIKPMNRIIENISRQPIGSSWPVFVKAAAAISADDNRDMAKSILFKAWMKHWQSNSSETPTTDPNYIPPDKICSFVCMPEAWMHEFSFSESSFPVFSSAMADLNSSLIDVSMVFSSADTSLVGEIEASLSGLVSVEFPLSLTRQASDTIILNFHCNNDEVSSFVSIIRTRILDQLVKKGLAENLQDSLKISLSAAGNLPPFIMTGMLQDGWPAKAAQNIWKKPSLKDIADLLQVSPENQQSVMKRWQLLITTGKGRSQILALAGIKHLRLKSFESPLD